MKHSAPLAALARMPAFEVTLRQRMEVAEPIAITRGKPRGKNASPKNETATPNGRPMINF
jgi:hypothetical protein